MNQVEKQFMDKATRRGQMLLFSKDDAVAFIQACKEHNIEILGLDGYYVFAAAVHPSPENSIDFSSDSYVMKQDDIYEEAVAYVKGRNEKLLFEVVCAS